MRYFLTTYPVGCTTYSAFIFAPDITTAESYARLRSLGESVLGEVVTADVDGELTPLVSHLYQTGDLTKCLEMVTFYSWILSRAKALGDCSADSILGKDGLLHELIHEMSHPAQHPYSDDIFAKLFFLESLVPGVSSFDLGLYAATHPHLRDRCS